MGVKPSDDEISAILSEIDVTYHGQLELQDYLQVDWMSVMSWNKGFMLWQSLFSRVRGECVGDLR